MIRGRTDAKDDSASETALARRRAEAAADFLIGAGAPKEKVRVTWQGAGDELTGLATRERGKNRRVEIEFYTGAPVVVSLGNDYKVQREARRSNTAASL
jgi:outer membrane protein OmpA-like peptidoglycan-associated protein